MRNMQGIVYFQNLEHTDLYMMEHNIYAYNIHTLIKMFRTFTG